LSGYIHFTDEQKLLANDVDLEQFLRSQGEKLIPSGRDKRLASDHSITIRGNRWYDHAAERGGGAISFVQTFYGDSFPEAVIRLLGDRSGVAYPTAAEKEEQKKEFTLPPAAPSMRRAFAYLIKTRGIDRAVLSAFVHEKLIYEDAQYHNAVFVGKDEDCVPRHAHKRSTNTEGPAFRQNVEGSNAKYPFHWNGKSGLLFVFEAPIDLLSYISLNREDWQDHSYVACCGTSFSPVKKMLETGTVSKVYLCLDNDEAGQNASLRMQELLREQGVESECIVPTYKDWNEDLTFKEQEVAECRMC